MRRTVTGFMTMASVAAGTMLYTPSSPAAAGPGSCQSSDVGCTHWSVDFDDQYRFNSSDDNLNNNYYVTENCGVPFAPPCYDEFRVAGHFGGMRLNSAAQVRMCVYANTGYNNPLYWVTKHNVWASTPGTAGESLRYRQVNSC